MAAEREEPGISVHQALRHGLRQPEGQSQTAHEAEYILVPLYRGLLCNAPTLAGYVLAGAGCTGCDTDLDTVQNIPQASISRILPPASATEESYR